MNVNRILSGMLGSRTAGTSASDRIGPNGRFALDPWERRSWDVEIRARLSYVPPHLYADTQRRVRWALRRWRDRIGSVRVFLTDDGGRQQITGTRCRIVIEPAGGTTIVATGRGRDPKRATSDALRCLQEILRRRAERGVSRSRARQGSRSFEDAA